METYRYHVIIERDEDGVFVASCPALQGCYTQGDTLGEAMANIKEAIRGHIAARKQLGEPVGAVPPPERGGIKPHPLGRGGINLK